MKDCRVRRREENGVLRGGIESRAMQRAFVEDDDLAGVAENETSVKFLY
jgi:hypothetical protein